MGLFGRGKSGGMINVIRCDEDDYLVWKWRPAGQDVNSTTRENAIRYGSSLRVKAGESAVFVYKQQGQGLDIIEGPYDDTIRTANFPVLSSLVGMAFGGESPFQAEVYYINTSGIININFAIPFFDVFDPRFLDYAVPMAVRGSINFRVVDAKKFVYAHRLIDFSLQRFKEQIRDAVIRRVKSAVVNAPADHGIPVLQIERKIEAINDIVLPRLKEDFEDFAVTLSRLDISSIEVDKESAGYLELRDVTAVQQTSTIHAQTAANIRNMNDMQRINAENVAETARIQREEAQRAQRLQTETQFIGAHALDRQADVMQTAAQNLGSGGGWGGGSGSSGIDPAQFMTGMAVGGALGNQMAGMVNNMGQTMNQYWQQPPAQQGATPPPVPGASETSYYVVLGGQQSGPYKVSQLQPLVQQGRIDPATMVWAQGMPAWTPAGQVAELQPLFPTVPPPVPGATPGAMPPPLP